MKLANSNKSESIDRSINQSSICFPSGDSEHNTDVRDAGNLIGPSVLYLTDFN